jgi:formylglycine-generating enzyme required for sulfatase activity
MKPDCRSASGAFDMVGNLWEWTADRADRKTGFCGSWSASCGSDLGCVGGDGSSGLPDAIIRGGDYDDAGGADVFAIGSAARDLIASPVGFRCAK